MVVERSGDFVKRSWVEYFLHLLQEGATIVKCRWHEGILPQKDVLSLDRRIKVLDE